MLAGCAPPLLPKSAANAGVANASSAAAHRQREVARGAALGGAEADQQLEVVRILAQHVLHGDEVGGQRSARRAEVSGARVRRQRERRN